MNDENSVPTPVYFLIYDGFNLLDLAGPMQAFETAVLLTDGLSPYALHTIAMRGGKILSSGGIVIDTQIAADHLPLNSLLLVIGGEGVKAALECKDVVDWIRQQAQRIDTIASICTGAFLLAEAGILNGRKATTHWIACDDLGRRYDKVIVEADRIFTRHGNVWTSAGVTAGIDLALALIEERQGSALAGKVAQRLVVYLRRPAGQTQFSSFLALAERDNEGKFASLHDWVRTNLARPITLSDLASQAGMSERSFSRHYTTIMGMTPKQGLNFIRAEAARTFLQSSHAPLNRIARMSGFNSVDTMNRVIESVFGIRAAAIRR